MSTPAAGGSPGGSERAGRLTDFGRRAMQSSDLASKHCKSCESGVPPLPPDQVHALMVAFPDWELSEDGKRIRREWRVKDFATGLDFFRRVGEVAEAEDH